LIVITHEEVVFLEEIRKLLELSGLELSADAIWHAPGIIEERVRSTFYFDPKRWRHTDLPGATGQYGCLSINATHEVGMLHTRNLEQAMVVLIPITVWQKPHKVFP
jgi:hypothetical protein